MNLNKNQLVLEDVDRYLRIAILDSLTSEPTFAERPATGMVANGRFFSDGSTFFALIFFEGMLFARIQSQVFGMTDDMIVEVQTHGCERILSVIVNGERTCSHHYTLNPNTFDDDPTPFIEDEDFDFGLFLSNISRSRSRKDVLVESLGR